jgi:murein DD-endopeptidase MepM/ murein hydrolase activator NlpD
MVSASVLSKIDHLESQVSALKQNPWKLERDINNLLKALNAEPATERDYLRERLFTIAATALLTAGVIKGFDSSPAGKFFTIQNSRVNTEQVSPKLSPSLAKPEAQVYSTTAKPEAKPTAKPDAKLDRLMRAISTQESGENHTVINGDSGASGKWQVMPANIPSWSKAALGREVSHSEFMGSAQIQQQVVKHRLNLYLTQQTKPGRSEEEIIRRVASTWYSGQPQLWNNTRPQYSNGRQYPSIEQYTRSVWNLFLKTDASTPKTDNFKDTKAIISTWGERWQKDAEVGDRIGGYVVSSGRGWRIHPVSKEKQFHDGVDLAAPIGTPLFAIADGEVRCYQDDRGGGTVASFTSNLFPNLEFELLHLSKCGAVGKVKAGQVIGYIGSTGNSTGPHLHLEISSKITGNTLRVRAGWLHWFVTGEKP